MLALDVPPNKGDLVSVPELSEYPLRVEYVGLDAPNMYSHMDKSGDAEVTVWVAIDQTC